jgi:tetratricopeptide (TPR) repeat protein
MALILAAVGHQQAGRAAAAAASCRQVLEHDPDQLQAIMLLGLIEANGADLAAAEALFTRYLALVPDDPDALHNLGRLRQKRGDDLSAIRLFERAAAGKPELAPIFNDLGVSLHRLGRRKAALIAVDRALAIDPDFTVAHCNRGMVLRGLNRPRDAVSAYRRALTLAPDLIDAWHGLGVASHNAEALDQAEAAFRRLLSLDPANLDAYDRLAQTLERAGRVDEARPLRKEWARRHGVVVTPSAGGAPAARILLLGAAGPYNMPTQALFDLKQFETIALPIVRPEDAEEDAADVIARLPAFDIVFNAVASPDLGAPYLAATAAFCAGLKQPVLNPPARVLQTRRDLVPSLLAGIPGLAVPETRIVHRSELLALAADERSWPRPLLVRPLGTHGGIDLTRIERAADLAAYLRSIAVEQHYLSEFRDYRSADGYYRKYRFIFIDRKVFPYHLAIARDWLVHYWRADMDEADWMKREEEDFLADYEALFSGVRGDAVREVARRLDLDYAGMDCGVTADGSVLMFEANASMLTHLDDSREGFSYKHRYVPRIFAAMGDLVLRRAAGRR